MPKELREDVVRTVKDQKVEFIHLWFTDVLGFLKSFTIDIEELEMAMSEGMGFDGSSILGFARIQESDMIALPDPTTLQILPWRTGGQLVATMFCDIVSPDGAPYEADPRTTTSGTITAPRCSITRRTSTRPRATFP
jgi:glutamine synthetase